MTDALYTIDLPWPNRDLHQNARPAHWGVLARARKAYRTECAWRALACGAERMELPEGDVLRTRITFHPPDNRKRNYDGMIGAFKSGQDGVADQLGIPDERWALPEYRIGDTVKGGAVIVEVIT